MDSRRDGPTAAIFGEIDGIDRAADGLSDESIVAAETAIGESRAVADLVFVAPDRLHEAVAAGVDRPLLVVGPTSHPFAVTVDRAIDLLEGTVSYDTAAHRALTVSTNGDRLADATSELTLVTAEPARISEFGVDTGGTVHASRADGIVVATPFGSHGYARAAGGSLVAPGGGIVVVPIAPFAIEAPPRVESPPIEVSIEREGDVDVIVDGRVLETVGTDATVRVDRGRTFELVDSWDDRDWKNSNESSTESVS